VIRVLLVDDDVLVRSGLPMTLAAAEEIEVVGEAVDATVVGDDDDALGHERRNRNAKPPVAPAGQRTPPEVGDGEKERQRDYPVEARKARAAADSVGSATPGALRSTIALSMNDGAAFHTK